MLYTPFSPTTRFKSLVSGTAPLPALERKHSTLAKPRKTFFIDFIDFKMINIEKKDVVGDFSFLFQF